jgi:ADP-heptose:LPS heptosyltransferase
MKKQIYFYLFWVVHFYHDSLFKLKINKLISNDEIVVVKLDKMGDFILWINSAKSLRKKFKNQKITVVMNENISDIYYHINIFDNIIAIDIKKFKKNLFYRFRTIIKLRKKSYSIAYHPTYSRHFSLGDSVMRILRAERKVGFIGDLVNQTKIQKKISDKWYTELVGVHKNSVMELEFHKDFVKQTYDQNFVNNLFTYDGFEKKDFKINKKFFICSPFSSLKVKNWPIKKFIEIIEYIKIKKNLQPVIIGSKNEIKDMKYLSESLRVDHLNFSGKINLVELMSLINQAEFLIANDSGPIHLATMVKTKAFVILGDHDPKGKFFPYRLDNRNFDALPIAIEVNEKYKKIDNIPVDIVLRNILEHINKN